MSVGPGHVVGAVAVGIGATLVMDLWNLFLKRAFGIPSLNYCLLGRWIRHMPSGTFRHSSIAAAQQKSLECPVGWIAHYTIGVMLALGLVVLTSGDWLGQPTLPLALLYGIGTVVFPFFVLQPSLGLGVAGSRTPNPTRTRLKSLMTHVVFGLGLYVSDLALICIVLGCAGPERQLPPRAVLVPGIHPRPDTATISARETPADTSLPMQSNLPPGYTLTDSTSWATMLEDGGRAVLRRGATMIDTVDLYFGVVAVGTDSLVFLPVRTDTTPVHTTEPPWFESAPTEHVFWTLESRRELRSLLPFFDAYFSSPVIEGTMIHYWGIAPNRPTNRLYAMRYDFRTGVLDSLSLNREDPLATDYRYHLTTPQIQGNEISFGDMVLDSATWRVLRREPPSK
jgi:hypothetical protein